MFKGFPIWEARASLHVQPNDKDISGATKEDPENCAYARCLRRTLSAANVFVFKTTAYVQTLNEKGENVMERFKVKTYAREYLLRFDGGEKIAPGGFVFHAPSRCQTLAYKHRQQLKRIRAGKISPRVTQGQKPKVKNYSLRKGTGRVHLFGAEDQIKVPRT
jgi:hypothetical protein